MLNALEFIALLLRITAVIISLAGMTTAAEFGGFSVQPANPNPFTVVTAAPSSDFTVTVVAPDTKPRRTYLLLLSARGCGGCIQADRRITSYLVPAGWTYGATPDCMIQKSEDPELMDKYGVEIVPAFILIRDGREAGGVESGKMAVWDAKEFVRLGVEMLVPRKTPALAATLPNKGYPLRATTWNGCGSWEHLTQGEHAGMFDVGYLKSLAWNELQSLHADAHEGRIDWRYARPPETGFTGRQAQPAYQQSRGFFQQFTGGCANGRCR